MKQTFFDHGWREYVDSDFEPSEHDHTCFRSAESADYLFSLAGYLLPTCPIPRMGVLKKIVDNEAHA